jgi:glycosyltransferase involved in cell wall biosynthesis
LNNKFSILTASYNKAHFLNEWANSILVQDYRPLEVIFVNDRSNDKTLKRINKMVGLFKQRNIEIKIISNNKREFCGTSYDIARANATGSFLGVLDSDDALVPGAVKYVMNVYNKHPEITYLYTQFQICDIKLNVLKRGFCARPPKHGSLLAMGMRGIHGFSHWRTFSLRCKHTDKIFKRGLACSVDKYMGYMLEELGVGGFVNKVCYKYRKGIRNSITRINATKTIWFKIIRDAQERRKKVKIKSYPIVLIDPE